MIYSIIGKFELKLLSVIDMALTYFFRVDISLLSVEKSRQSRYESVFKMGTIE